jgi:hypothetical protein
MTLANRGLPAREGVTAVNDKLFWFPQASHGIPFDGEIFLMERSGEDDCNR